MASPPHRGVKKMITKHLPHILLMPTVGRMACLLLGAPLLLRVRLDLSEAVTPAAIVASCMPLAAATVSCLAAASTAILCCSRVQVCPWRWLRLHASHPGTATVGICTIRRVTTPRSLRAVVSFTALLPRILLVLLGKWRPPWGVLLRLLLRKVRLPAMGGLCPLTLLLLLLPRAPPLAVLVLLLPGTTACWDWWYNRIREWSRMLPSG